jgi:hypothetical protein
MTTVAIACPTGIHALLFSGLRGGKAAIRKIGIARTERTGTQRQKRCEGDDGK